MSTRNEELAGVVVDAFKEILSEKALQAISEKEFHELALIVREAFSLELSEAAEMVTEVANKLRGMTEPKDLGL